VPVVVDLLELSTCKTSLPIIKSIFSISNPEAFLSIPSTPLMALLFAILELYLSPVSEDSASLPTCKSAISTTNK
jgi:hypothetical protein